MAELLAPRQLGYGVVESRPCIQQNMTPNQAIVKLDLRNEVSTIICCPRSGPQYFPFCLLLPYFEETSCCSHQVYSKVTPLARLSLHKVCSLDDVTLGGYVEDILLQDLRVIEKEAGELGLHLNHSKSEIICGDSVSRDETDSE